MPKTLDPARIDFISTVDRTSDLTRAEQLKANAQAVQDGTDGTVTEAPANSGSLKKNLVLGAIAVIALYCIVVFFVALFRPTLNRKSDFEAYGLPVLGEIPRQK